MLSSADKVILGATALVLASITGGAGRWAWSQLDSANGTIGGPAVKVADLSDPHGTVKTRHREVLAWTDGIANENLHEGDRIRTLAGATAEIHYDDGLVVMMDPNSQITVHAPQTGVNGARLVAAIDVVDGSVRAKVAQGNALAVSNGARTGQGEIVPTGDAGAQVEIHAADSADGSTQVKVDAGQAKLAPPTPTPGASPQANASPTPVPTEIVLNAGESADMGAPAATPTVAIAMITPPPTPAPTATPVLPIATGLPPLPNMEGQTDTTIRWTLPASDITEIRVRGRLAAISGGAYTVPVFGLKPGVNKIDIEYHFADGHWARQVQLIRVR